MKRTLALLLACMVILSALVFTACGGSAEKKSEEKAVEGVTFTTVGDLKKSGTTYDFITANSDVQDEAVVCQINKDAEGDLTIPATHDDKDVVAVISEAPEAATKLSSVTIEVGVLYVENCFKDLSYIESLTLPSSVKAFYHSFNNNSGLKEISFPFTVKYIVDSFNSALSLEKIDTNGFVYGIADAFNDTPVLADVKFNGSIQKIENSFVNCGVNAVSFIENIHDVVSSFNECVVLESLSVEQIANTFKGSFCKCTNLKTVKFAQSAENIMLSFNDDEALENVDFGGEPPISDSFQNCGSYKLPEPKAE